MNLFFTMKSTISLLMLLLMAAIFFVIGGTVLIRKKPSVLSSRWFFSIFVLGFISVIFSNMLDNLTFITLPLTEHTFNVVNIELILFTYILENWITFLLMLLIPIIYISILVVCWFGMQGYTILGITNETLRDALHYGLNELNSPYEEMLTKIKLSELDTELQITLQPWTGTGFIKIKDQSKRAFLRKLAQHMRKYFKEYDNPTKNILAVLYVFIGVILTLLAILTFKMLIRII